MTSIPHGGAGNFIKSHNIMKDLTIGQILGIFPMYSKIPIRYQYFSKIHKVWLDCHESELKAYDKYGYRTRTI